jgi:hypothetical protein
MPMDWLICHPIAVSRACAKVDHLPYAKAAATTPATLLACLRLLKLSMVPVSRVSLCICDVRIVIMTREWHISPFLPAAQAF